MHAAAKQLHFLPAATQREAFPMCTKVSHKAHIRQLKPDSGTHKTVKVRFWHTKDSQYGHIRQSKPDFDLGFQLLFLPSASQREAF